ncbi:NINE protein [Blastopirellula marina]|uniref:TM2 domain-containing protein n=1 Tax=Blastopirellula marina TaxID=124 RepID=A0A2S8F7J2_9BACT|nr:TM2 domain-containing protein [Blastopirellula marina]PQO28131.1 hypothetical protein C5Y98_24810 [Blastopirellula marina]PTL41671.1 NINE protein [Blastopirellula marina]
MTGNNTHSIVFGYVAWAFGISGAHRFYYGKPLTGVLWLCTGGLLLIGWIIDFFLIPAMDEECNHRYRSGPIDYNVAWLLCFFLGVFGIHRFYMGKWISGIIWLCTGGLFALGWFYDVLTLNEQVDETNRELAAN